MLRKNIKKKIELKDPLKPSKYIKRLDQNMKRYVDPKKVLNLENKSLDILFSNKKRYSTGILNRFNKEDNK